MAYAMIAGLPPVFGLYAALVPQIIYALMGTSRQLAVGPVAMDSLLVASGLGALALSGIEEYIAMALFLALFMGGIYFSRCHNHRIEPVKTFVGHINCRKQSDSCPFKQCP